MELFATHHKSFMLPIEPFYLDVFRIVDSSHLSLGTSIVHPTFTFFDEINSLRCCFKNEDGHGKRAFES